MDELKYIEVVHTYHEIAVWGLETPIPPISHTQMGPSDFVVTILWGEMRLRKYTMCMFSIGLWLNY